MVPTTRRLAFSLGLYTGAASAGLFAGLSVAAGGLALDGRFLIPGSVERNEVFLVLGPLLGLLPVAGFSWVAARSRPLAARGPAVMGVWVLCAIGAVTWFGLLPLLR